MNRFPTMLAGAAAAAMLVAATALPGQAQGDFTWPRLLVIGTPGTASGSFASTNGWGPVLQRETGVTVRVVPEDNEPQRFRRLTDRRDIQISSVSGAEMRFQVQGIGGYASAPPAAMRVLWHHNDTPWGYVVSGNSDIQSIDDVARGGVRVTRGMFSPPMQVAVNEALPAFLGLTPEEAADKIVYIPAGSYAENCRSVVEGKSDVAYCAPISSVLAEMEGAPGGIRWLDMPMDRAEAWDRFLAHRPDLVPTTIDLGVSTARGVGGLTSNFLYAVPADTDEDFAYNMAKWLHESFDAYKSSHPLAERMSLDHFRLYLDRSPMPIHAGTVRYLREVGAWTDEDDVWNDAAADLMDQWLAAREAAMAEARGNRVEINFENPAFLEILARHTADLEGFRSRI